MMKVVNTDVVLKSQ